MKNALRQLALICLVLFSASAKAQDPNFYIFLCLGQSNMEGYPGIPDEHKGPVDPRFQVLAAVDFPELKREKGNWYTATPPLSQPASTGAVVFGSTEGAGVYETANAPVPPAPPYPGPQATTRMATGQRLCKTGSPIATPVAGKPGYVYSPFTSNACMVDVQGLAPGSMAKDPYTGRSFRVP